MRRSERNELIGEAVQSGTVPLQRVPLPGDGANKIVQHGEVDWNLREPAFLRVPRNELVGDAFVRALHGDSVASAGHDEDHWPEPFGNELALQHGACRRVLG